MAEARILLLRGVNVGGRGRLTMAALRDALVAEGARDVATYLQSGNAVFHGNAGARRIAATLAARTEVSPAVMVLCWSAFEAIVAACPFDAAAAPRQHHVAFLAARPEATAGLDRLAEPDERWQAGDKAIYLHCPSGAGRSKLVAGLERALGVGTTLRNWGTVAALAREMDGT